MKKYFALLLSCIILLSQGMVTFAEENNLNENYKWVDVTETEWIENNNDTEISPCLLYIANVITSIVKVDSSTVSIQAETVCVEKMKSITVTYTLQKWNGSKWVDAGSQTATAYDVSVARKTYRVSNVSTGRYRCKASALATGYNGYSETLTGYSGSISL